MAEQFISIQCNDGSAEFVAEEIFPGYLKVTGLSGMDWRLHQTRPELSIVKASDVARFTVEQEPDDLPVEPQFAPIVSRDGCEKPQNVRDWMVKNQDLVSLFESRGA